MVHSQLLVVSFRFTFFWSSGKIVAPYLYFRIFFRNPLIPLLTLLHGKTSSPPWSMGNQPLILKLLASPDLEKAILPFLFPEKNCCVAFYLFYFFSLPIFPNWAFIFSLLADGI